MNKKYMDFVPDDSAKKKKKSANGAGGTVRRAPTKVAVDEEMPVRVVRRNPSAGSEPRRSAPVRHPAEHPVRRPVAKPETRPVGRPATHSVGRPVDRPVVRPATRSTKRPASADARVTPARGRRSARNEQVNFGVIEDLEPVDNNVGTERKPLTDKTMAIPRTPFINQNRVEKRPLSKNVYRRKPTIAPKKEEAVGPVTIIAKPEKEKHVGLIITIILTIILGAAAGTVAFLLLPK